MAVAGIGTFDAGSFGFSVFSGGGSILGICGASIFGMSGSLSSGIPGIYL